MKRINLYTAFVSLTGTGTKEDVIIQVAKQQNIRFNELPQLQKDVDKALEDSQRLGFVDRQGPFFKMNSETPTQAAQNMAGSQTNNQSTTEQRGQIDGHLMGQGDGRRARRQHKALCAACSGQDHSTNPNCLEHQMLLGNSVCSVCDPDDQFTSDGTWQDVNNTLP